MNTITFAQEDGAQTLLPVSRVKLVDMRKDGNDWKVRVFHELNYLNPLIFYIGKEPDVALQHLEKLREVIGG